MIALIIAAVVGGLVASTNRKDVLIGVGVGLVCGAVVLGIGAAKANPHRLISYGEARGLQTLIAVPAAFGAPKFNK